jgi:hypothetical protein
LGLGDSGSEHNLGFALCFAVAIQLTISGLYHVMLGYVSGYIVRLGTLPSTSHAPDVRRPPPAPPFLLLLLLLLLVCCRSRLEDPFAPHIRGRSGLDSVRVDELCEITRRIFLKVPRIFGGALASEASLLLTLSLFWLASLASGRARGGVGVGRAAAGEGKVGPA